MRRLLFSLFSISTLSAEAHASSEEDCGRSPSSYRAIARHIEGKGIGYTKGYTSVDLFIAPPELFLSSWVPFIDTRLHVFNNGRIATNIGLGLRYLSSSFVYGINSYYDYRETGRQKYNQYSLGFEALGKVWDFRVNGYLPVGSKFSSVYNTQFGYFKQNQMMIKQNIQFAMKGLSAEAGVHIKKMKNMEFYGAFGPYYFEKVGQNAVGGKLRISGTFLDHIKVEGSTSYDPIFHWIGQGELSLVFPFGPSKKIPKTRRQPCSKTIRLTDRALESVARQEIIVLSKKDVFSLAINPITGLPWVFVFVDNTSHSLGTFESPYPTLLDAERESSPGDVIYVSPGDGTVNGMDQGITLKARQQLISTSALATFPTTQGLVAVPSLSDGKPTIMNFQGGDSVITMSDDCVIKGFKIVTNDSLKYGIKGGDPELSAAAIVHGVVEDNAIIVEGLTDGGAGIGIVGVYFLEIVNNQVSNTSSASFDGIDIQSIGADTVEVVVVGNKVQGGKDGHGISVRSKGSSQCTILVDGNTCSGGDFSSQGGHGLYLSSENFSTLSFSPTTSDRNSVSDNICRGGNGTLGSGGHGIGIYSRDSSQISGLLIENTCTGGEGNASNTNGNGIYAQDAYKMGLNLQGNQGNALAGTPGIYLTATPSLPLPPACFGVNNNKAPTGITLDSTGSVGYIYQQVSSGNVPTPTLNGTYSIGTCQ